MTDRKNRRLLPILLLTMFGIALFSVQVFFRWRAAVIDDALRSSGPADEVARLRDLAERLAWYRPDDIDLVFRRAELADRAGDAAAAAAILSAVPDSDPQASRARYLEGLVHRNAYRLDDAERAFRASAKIDPKMVEAHRNLIGLLGVEHRRADQADALQAWIRSGFGVIEPLRLMGQSVVVIPPGTLDKTTDEGTILERALEAQPQSRHVRPALARFLRNRGESAEASKLLDEWLKDQHNDIAACIEKLATLVESGEDDAAQTFAATIHESTSEIAEYWLYLGDLKRNRKRWDEAADCYRKASSIDPRNPETYYRLAECLRSSGQKDESAHYLKKHADLRRLAEAAAAVDANRPTGSAILEAARLCADLGRTLEARAWVNEALRLDRDNAEARALLTRIESEMQAR